MGRKARGIMQNQQGLSMILVLCIGAVFAALSAALVYAASVLTANANRQLIEQEVYTLATSFSDVLDDQLTGYSTAAGGAQTDSLAAFIDKNYLLQTTYSDATEHTFADESSGLEITLKKTPADEVDKSEYVAALATKGYEVTTLNNQLNSFAEKELSDYVVEVTVTAKQGSEKFSYTRSYQHTRKCNVAYYTIGTDTARYSSYQLTKVGENETNQQLVFKRTDVDSTYILRKDADTEIKIHYELNQTAKSSKFVRQ